MAAEDFAPAARLEALKDGVGGSAAVQAEIKSAMAAEDYALMATLRALKNH